MKEETAPKTEKKMWRVGCHRSGILLVHVVNSGGEVKYRFCDGGMVLSTAGYSNGSNKPQFFDTWAEAHDLFVERQKARVSVAKKALEAEQEYLAVALDMAQPEGAVEPEWAWRQNWRAQ